MPPSTIPTGRSQPTLSSSTSHVQLPRIFLLVLGLVAVIRLTVLYSLRRRRIQTAKHNHVQEKNPVPGPVQPEKDVKQLLHPLSADHLESTVQPIYPWTSPPQQLPGPYDPRLYPLPSIRRHSYDPSIIQSEDEEHCKSVSYTRRVSTNSIPSQRSILQGNVTTSSKGWRRNQWTVTGE